MIMPNLRTYFHSPSMFENLDKETKVLLIPEKVCVKKTIMLDRTLKQKKLIVILQAGASVTLHEESDLTDVKIHLQSNASLGYYASITNTLKKNITVILEGEHARVSVMCAYLMNGDQSCTINTRQEHCASQSESSILLRGVLADQASIVHRGVVFVPKNVTGVCAQQNNKTILLSRDALVDSLPALEVLSQNVQCSHGSAVGKLDEEQLLYLKSRGLPEDKAKRLLLEAFFGERKIKKGFERVITKLREM